MALMTQKRNKTRRGTVPRPTPPDCPVHGIAMFAGSSEPRFTRYYCRVPGCRCSTKVARFR